MFQMFLCNFKGTLPMKKIEKFKKQFLASKKKQNQIKEQQKSENDSLKSRMESD